MASGRTRVRLRERLLVFLGVCLPVPVFAATGLSVPLPATVERIAAELVPFADPVTPADGQAQTRGSIVLTEAERVRLVVVADPAAARVPVRSGSHQGRQAVAGRRSPTVPARAAPGRIPPPRRPKPEPFPAPPITAPAEDGPGRSDERPRPAKPEPEHRPKPERAPRPKPKHERPKPRPKPTPHHEPKPKPKPEEPKPRPEKPSPAPEPAAAAPDHGETTEKDKRPHTGKPPDTAPEPDLDR